MALLLQGFDHRHLVLRQQPPLYPVQPEHLSNLLRGVTGVTRQHPHLHTQCLQGMDRVGGFRTQLIGKSKLGHRLPAAALLAEQHGAQCVALHPTAKTRMAQPVGQRANLPGHPGPGHMLQARHLRQ